MYIVHCTLRLQTNLDRGKAQYILYVAHIITPANSHYTQMRQKIPPKTVPLTTGSNVATDISPHQHIDNIPTPERAMHQGLEAIPTHTGQAYFFVWVVRDLLVESRVISPQATLLAEV